MHFLFRVVPVCLFVMGIIDTHRHGLIVGAVPFLAAALVMYLVVKEERRVKRLVAIKFDENVLKTTLREQAEPVSNVWSNWRPCGAKYSGTCKRCNRPAFMATNGECHHGFPGDVDEAQDILHGVVSLEIRLEHPLPLGSKVVSLKGEMDDDEHGNQRIAPPGSVGTIQSAEFHPKGQGWTYHITFDNGTWVAIDQLIGGIDEPEYYDVQVRV
jgi:hypothetical protein